MTKDWLTINDIAENLAGHIDTAMIDQFHQNAMMRELLGAAGSDYPSWSLRYWKLVAEANCDGGLSPEEAGVFIRALMDRESRFEEDPEEAAEGVISEEHAAAGNTGFTVQTIEFFAESFAAALVRHARQEGLFPPREDRLVDRTEAARLLNCSPQALARRVKPVQPGSWSYVQIQEHLARLRGDRK